VKYIGLSAEITVLKHVDGFFPTLEVLMGVLHILPRPEVTIDRHWIDNAIYFAL
jgi:hypothetical protein